MALQCVQHLIRPQRSSSGQEGARMAGTTRDRAYSTASYLTRRRIQPTRFGSSTMRFFCPFLRMTL